MCNNAYILLKEKVTLRLKHLCLSPVFQAGKQRNSLEPWQLHPGYTTEFVSNQHGKVYFISYLYKCHSSHPSGQNHPELPSVLHDQRQSMWTYDFSNLPCQANLKFCLKFKKKDSRVPIKQLERSFHMNNILIMIFCSVVWEGLNSVDCCGYLGFITSPALKHTDIHFWNKSLIKNTYPPSSPFLPHCLHTNRDGFSQETSLWWRGVCEHEERKQREGMVRFCFLKTKKHKFCCAFEIFWKFSYSSVHRHKQ